MISYCCIDVQGIQQYLQVQATLAAVVGLTDRHPRPTPCKHAINQGAPKYQARNGVTHQLLPDRKYTYTSK